MNRHFELLRRRLTLAGGRAASGAADAVHGRGDEAEFRPATLVETPLRHIAVGDPEPWREDVAFLDGTQHVELVGYVGTAPVTAAIVRAAVRLRRSRKFTVAVAMQRTLLLGRREVLAAFDSQSQRDDLVPLDDEGPAHPIRDAQLARALVDRARSALEIQVAARFRASCGPDTWLVIDGSLAATPEWGSDSRLLGVVKGHAMLPFSGDELETYLTLPRGHRTSIFTPESRRVTPLHSWALRLHEFAGRDLFHGFIRVEAPATDATLERADQISRHLLAERAPLSNDPRADRLLYGIHDVERYLRAQGA